MSTKKKPTKVTVNPRPETVVENFGTAIGMRFVRQNPELVALVNGSQAARLISEMVAAGVDKKPALAAALAVVTDALKKRRDDVEVRVPTFVGGVRWISDDAAHAEWNMEQKSLWDTAAASGRASRLKSGL